MKRIGIVTFYSSINYGAYLQAYALCEKLNTYDNISAEIIQIQTAKELDFYESQIKLRKNPFVRRHNLLRDKMFRQQREKLQLSIQLPVSDHLAEAENNIEKLGYDCLIAGSDEIWRIDGIRGFPTFYFLQWRSKSRKFAYAVSGREPFQSLSACQYQELKKNLLSFEYIGVRDEATFSSLQKMGLPQSILHYNLDPTLIYGFKPNVSNGKKILSERYHIDSSKKCVGIMYHEKRSYKPVLLNYMKRVLPKSTQFISLYDWTLGIPNTPTLTPFEWIDVIAALDCLVTMYFHACCFSILAHTAFYAIEARESTNERSKLYDLLRRFKLLEYYSLGLEEAIQSGKLYHTLNHSSEINQITDELLADGKNEFESFVQKIIG